jgi:hypothetical protein
VVDTVKYDVLPCMASRSVGGPGVGRTWAYGNVIGVWTKSVRIVRIEAVRNGKAEEGRGDEAVTHSDGALYTRRGFVALGGHIGNVGGMVGGGIVHEDLLPHHLFGWGVIV